MVHGMFISPLSTRVNQTYSVHSIRQFLCFRAHPPGSYSTPDPVVIPLGHTLKEPGRLPSMIIKREWMLMGRQILGPEASGIGTKEEQGDMSREP